MANVEVDSAIAAKLRLALDVEAVTWTSLAHRGYTHNGRWVASLADGRSAFVKAAVDAQTARWLRAEHYIYSYPAYATLDQPFLPQLLGWVDDGELPLLVLEDLQHADWPPPWTPAHIDAVRTLLHRLAETPPPPGLPQLEQVRASMEGWRRVAAEPEPLLRLGLCSPAWLDRSLPTLQAAADAAPLAGNALVHRDLRSDNLCIREGRALLVDWNLAVAGNPLFDLAAWSPSLHTEGGPEPGDLGERGTGEIVALLAGYWAARAGLPVIPHAPRVRAVQQAQLKVALPWAARLLGLPPP
jgi:hypothetical protein